MIGFNTSPSITLFAEKNGVDRDSLVTLIKAAFGNHVDVLKTCHITYLSNGQLCIFEHQNFLYFSIVTVPVPVQLTGYPKTAIGILKVIEPHDGWISVLNAS